MLAVRSLLVAAVLAAPCRPAGADGSASEAPEETLRAATLGLSSPDASRRLAAIGRLEVALRARPDLSPRAVASLREVLRTRPPAEKAAAVALLASLRDPEATRLWLERFDAAQDDRVLQAVVDGARARRDDPEVERALVQMARAAGSSARRALALEALGWFPGPGARLMLTRPAEGGDWLVESGRALGLMHAGRHDGVPALLDLLDHADPAPRAHAWEGLVAITGQNLPATRAAWEAALRPAPDGVAPKPPPPAARDERYEGVAPAHVPTYYGIKIGKPRSHVVFCLDVSQSMWGEGIEQARRELTRALKSLPTTYAFDVVAFNEFVKPFEGRLVRAHPVQKQRVLAWLAELETVSYTNLFDAVETAFGYAGRGTLPAAETQRLDAVFLLSDGAPNRGRLRRHDEVVEGIAALSQRTVPVHTIGAGEEVFPLLRRIADVTGGTFADAFDFD